VTHANARLTVFGRGLIVDRWRSGWRQAHIAAAMGVSRKCVKTWIDRFRVEGQAGLHDRSSRPHRIANRTSLDVEAMVVAIRETQRKGRDWIAAEFGIPPRTVSRILARYGVPHLSLLDPMTGQRIRASKITSVRYERAQPGELVHMDVKKLGRIPDGGGWRAHGRSEEVRGRGNGYDYVHSLVDDHSRL
jgi:transposase